MCSFLKGRKLWLYVTGQRLPPKQQKDETEDVFALQLEDWDGVNHQIITWLRNTSTPSVSMEFGGYDITKDIWDMLASRYAGLDGAQEHHLMLVIKTVSEAELVSAHRERLRIHQLLMGIIDDFESPHTTVLATLASIGPIVIAPPRGHDKKQSNQKNSHLICSFCKHRGHIIDRCNMRARILQRSAALSASGIPRQGRSLGLHVRLDGCSSLLPFTFLLHQSSQPLLLLPPPSSYGTLV
uniref:Uncharacterized protein n=1 Tax=Fagus sylvatica TaxID=28930 RepID=A0A2N9GCQ4_FAGSY